MSYLSLVRQIEVEAEKGHTETEITEAVIRAVSPGLPLRDMLEIKCGFTLPVLLTILRGHYKVDSSTVLYLQLISLLQEPKETTPNFVFHAIELGCYGKLRMRMLRSIVAEPPSPPMAPWSKKPNTTVTVKAVKGKDPVLLAGPGFQGERTDG